MYGNRPRNNFSRGGGNGGGFGGPTPPVKVGEELDVTIEAVGEKGDGIAKKNGFVIFVPGVKAGQQVRIKVTRVLRKVGFGEVVGEGASSSDEGSDSGDEQVDESSDSESSGSEEFGDEASDESSAEGSEDFGEEQQ
jgi:predicted RNA-binding protein with TRAM domain